MATVIDELIVKLKLDPKEFQNAANLSLAQLKLLTDAVKKKEKEEKEAIKERKKAEKEALKEKEKAEKDAENAEKERIERRKKAFTRIVAAIAAATAAIKLFNSYISEGANLSRLARNLGTSADSLHRWGKAVKQSGGTAQGFQATIRGISAALTEQQTTGTSSISGWLSVLGVSLVDSEGKAKKLETLLLDIGEGVQRKTGNRADQFNILQSMGIDEGTANLLLKSREEAEKLIAQQSGFSDEAAKKAEQTEAKWLAIQERINAKFRELAEKLLPTIERLVDSLARSFEVMAPMVISIADAFAKINEATNGWVATILLALGALKLIKGLLPFGGKAAGSAASGAAAGGGASGAAGGLSLLGKAGVGTALFFGDTLSPVTKQDQTEYDLKSRAAMGDRDAAQKLARMQLDNQWWRKVFGGKATDAEVNQRAAELLGASARGMSGKVSGGDDRQSKISEAERANGLPPGLINSIIRQETGGRTNEFMEDPSKYHYGLNAEGKRIAGHTGKVSTAFGPFGILESTAAKPGYGVRPLENKSFDEQLRFMSEYIAARGKHAGSLLGGLSGYGEGPSYAEQVLGRVGGSAMTGISSAAGGRGSQGVMQMSIGEINIQTAATDARGIASAIRQELVMQANTGMR